MTLSDGDLEELDLYISESLEHLETVEVDLLAIEAAGENIDETLVNNVFRAAHSIKGGAGFFNLQQVQKLGHKIENVLDLIRSREIAPNSEVVNILLMSFDRLRELVNNYQESNKENIDEFVVLLTGLTTSSLPENQKKSLQEMREIESPAGGISLQVSEFDLKRAKEREEYVYLIEIDLIHDVQLRGRTPWELFKDIIACGNIMECEFNFSAVGTLDDEPTNQVPLDILFASVIDPSFIGGLFEDIPKEQIIVIQGPAHPQAMMGDLSSTEPEDLPQTTPVVEVQEPSPPPVEKPAPPAEKPPAKSAAEPVQVKPSAGGETLRVHVNLLDNLMNLAGELVLSRNQLQDAISRGDSRILRTSGQRMNLVTSEIQEAIMMTRMQPIGNILNKFSRVVRDLSHKRGVDIQLEISGKDVELDKTLIEGLNEPLTHMVRNAVDHGIGSQEQRVAQGKDPVGKIAMRAYHAAGQVVVKVSDDGNGIDPQKVAQASIEKGAVTEEQVMLMSDKEKLMLIMMPGVSTAEEVTDISGRGVGMDVVKTNIDHLGGKIEVESEIGKGTTFQITLPLTLAIIPSLLVSVQGERFAIPQVSISELIHVRASKVKERIEAVGNAEVLLLRGNLVPLVRLSDLLDIERMVLDPDSGELSPDKRKRISDRRSRKSDFFESASPSEAEEESFDKLPPRSETDRRYFACSDLDIVVLSTGTFNFGLVVEEMHETVEIVVRPLGRHLNGCQEYSGATVLGDGCVALILDASGLARKAKLTSLAGSSRALELEQTAVDETDGSRQTILLFHNASNEYCALPLDQVARIERIEKHQIEYLGERRAMQYRGSSLPLVTLQDAAEVKELDDESGLVVIVLHLANREVGLLAAMPVDIIDTEINLDQNTHRQPGIAGSCILSGQTTLMVDTFELVEGSGLPVDRTSPAPVRQGSATILLSEDSNFFRNQIRKYLEEGGYQVLAAECGQSAWELLCEHKEKIELIVTDLDMPNMNGLELTQKIKADPELAHLPVIALTSLADAEDIAAGKAAGVDAYEIKLDKEKLLETIRQLLEKTHDGKQ